MNVGIIQSNYLPWKGYFELINRVDLFVFHDDLQYTKNDWRNRNRILSSNGPIWLTVPCGSSEKRLICEVEIRDKKWQQKHWNQIRANYSRAHFFSEYSDFFEEVYMGKQWHSLSELNQYLIRKISGFLGVTTTFMDSRELALSERKAERVMEILKKVGATKYLSGPAAKNYLVEDVFSQEGIELEWMDYSGYPEYDQVFDGFTHEVSIIDLLFNTGLDARSYVFR